MKPEEIKQKLTALFRDFFEDQDIELTRETTAMDIFGWDSLSHVEMLMGVEDEFGVNFKRKEIVGLENVGELIDLIANKF